MNNKKLYSLLLLVAFCFFLVTPTLVKLLKRNADTSVFYAFSEEEHQEEPTGKEKVETFFSQVSNSFFLDDTNKRETAVVHTPYFKVKLIALRSFAEPPEA